MQPRRTLKTWLSGRMYSSEKILINPSFSTPLLGIQQRRDLDFNIIVILISPFTQSINVQNRVYFTSD